MIPIGSLTFEGPRGHRQWVGGGKLHRRVCQANRANTYLPGKPGVFGFGAAVPRGSWLLFVHSEDIEIPLSLSQVKGVFWTRP
jgi:hypothetical protein